MSFVAKEKDILTLENDKNYMVVECFEFENEPYLLLVSIPEDNKEYKEFSYSYKFARELVNLESGDYSLEIIKNVELLKKLSTVVKTKVN